MKRKVGFVALLIVAFAVVFTVASIAAQRGEGRGGQRGNQPPRPPMDSTPKNFDTRDYKIRVVTVTEGLKYPYSFLFLPDGSILVNELEGKMRLIRDGNLDPQPVSGVPAVAYAMGRGGLMDIILHPKFAQNHLVYFTYDKPGEKGSTQAVARGELKGNQLTNVKDVFVSENWGKAAGHLSARINFGRDGMLYVAIADHNMPEAVSRGDNHAGKVV